MRTLVFALIALASPAAAVEQPCLGGSIAVLGLETAAVRMEDAAAFLSLRMRGFDVETAEQIKRMKDQAEEARAAAEKAQTYLASCP